MFNKRYLYEKNLWITVNLYGVFSFNRTFLSMFLCGEQRHIILWEKSNEGV
jgi:hypothetical protein